MKNISKNLLLTPFISMLLVFAPVKADINVVTSIKPLHSLTSYIMEGVGEPGLIIDGVASPHNFQIKPSHAKMLQKADLVIWVGEDLESFLPTALKSIPKNSVVFPLLEQSGLKKLKFREKNIFEGHDDHGHDEHGHAHGEYDPHIWLDPLNAKVIVKKITNQLVKIDADNSSAYKANSKKLLKDLDNLTSTIKKDLNKNASFVVFHDAYQYFEERFNVNVLGAFTVNTDVMPGAEQLKEIREIIEHDNVSCVFSEPQFNPDIINAVAKDMNIKTGVLDPLGATLNPGKGLYFDLIKNMSSSFKGC